MKFLKNKCIYINTKLAEFKEFVRYKLIKEVKQNKI